MLKSAIPVIKRIAKKTSHWHRNYRRMVEMTPIPRGVLDRWYAKTRVFFIVSTGRTGTSWLAALLDRCPGALVGHEPVLREVEAQLAALLDPSVAFPYIARFRRKEIYLRAAASGRQVRTYGEVNNRLRWHIDAIRKHIPTATILFLVRDGRDVVRSLMGRGTYSGVNYDFRNFRPPEEDDLSARWDTITPFERTCWMWQKSNRHMRERLGAPVRFEDMMNSYDCMAKQILAPIGLNVDEDTWKKAVGTPRNTARSFNMGPWASWTDEERRHFKAICGAEMAACGYTMEA